MAIYTEYCGVITFNLEADADNLRQELVDGDWLEDTDGDKLYWTDDANYRLGVDMHTPTYGKRVYLNGGMQRSIHRVLEKHLSTNDIINNMGTKYRELSFDSDSIYASECNSGTRTVLTDSDIEDILEMHLDSYYCSLDDDIPDAEIKLYSWIDEFSTTLGMD